LPPVSSGGNRRRASAQGEKRGEEMTVSDSAVYVDGALTNQADFPSISFKATGKHYEFLCCFVSGLLPGVRCSYY
jgi:hypothetical protein